MLRKLLSVITLTTEEERRAAKYRNILRREAKIGGKLFGEVAPGNRREFFCLDEYTWIWHEEWMDEQGKRQVVTTRYDVRPVGILKAQDNQPYQYIGLEEARRFHKAVHLYNKHIDAELYGAAA